MTSTVAASRRIGVYPVAKQEDDPFVACLREGIRQIRRSTDVTLQQRRLLEDLERGRYLKGLRQFCEIGRTQTTCAADAVALLDRLKGFILAGHLADYTTAEAFGLETQANQELDNAQWLHAFHRSSGTCDRIVELASKQEVATVLLHHAVLRERPKLVSVR